MQEKVVILGAGVAGIGAGYRLDGAAEIYEARERYGGLCDNFTVGGFRFDTAVHLSFAKEKVVRSVFDQTPYFGHKPIAQNYCDGYWAKHPLQNNTFNLPVEEKIRIIKSIMERPAYEKVEDYEQWLIAQFGQYFADRYPKRYTRKYWCCEAADLSVEWITSRMYLPSIDEVLHGAMTDETPNTYYAEEMRYPKVGGYRAFFEHIADKMDIRLSHRVISIDPNKKIVRFENGNIAGYDRLLSSMPLPEVIEAIEDVPEDVIAASQRLYATSVTLVSVGYKQEMELPSLWFYVYNEEIPFARGYSPSMKSPDNVPSGRSSLQFEIYHSRYKPLPQDGDGLTDTVIKSLHKMGISKPSDVEVTDVRTAKYGNVVFYKGMERDRKIVRDYLKGQGITTIGRWGMWAYLWSNQAFMSGYKAALPNTGVEA